MDGQPFKSSKIPLNSNAQKSVTDASVAARIILSIMPPESLINASDRSGAVPLYFSISIKQYCNRLNAERGVVHPVTHGISIIRRLAHLIAYQHAPVHQFGIALNVGSVEPILNA